MAHGAHAGDDRVFRRKVQTDDGVALALYRYVPKGGGAHRPPVLMIPDLAFGRSSFALGNDGFAPFLQARGREVFIAELRGHGQSQVPGQWSLSEVITQDLVALMRAVQALRSGPVDVIACGYAGTLALASAGYEWRGKVGRVVALSTPIDAEVPNEGVRDLLQRGGRFDELRLDPRRFDLLFARGSDLGGRRLDAIRTRGLFSLSPSAATELLSWMEQGDFALPDGTTLKGRLKTYDRPTLLFLPLKDNFAHPEFATTLRSLSKASVTPRVLGRRNFLREDYTHLSMLHGRDAQADVFAPALAFLERAPSLSDEASR